MRSRPWILVLALIVAFTVLVMYHGWSIFKANERIKNYLVSQLKPVLGEESEIARLDMALGAVHLKRLRVVSPNKRYELLIHDLRIGYNLASLIKSGFRPKKAPQDILFVKPQLKIYSIGGEKDSTATPVMGENGQYWEKIKEFDFLKTITVSRGSITYIDSLGVSTVMATGISGWISTKEIPKANLRLVGKLFRSDQFNLKLNGVFDLADTRLDLLQVNMINFNWKDRIPFFIPSYMDIQGGLINGDVALSESGSENKFDIQGNFSVRNGEINLKDQNLYLRDIDLDAVIDDWDIIIENSTQTFNGTPVILEGRIKNILNPQFDLIARSDDFDIHQFHNELKPDHRIELFGNAEFNFAISSSYKNPTIDGFAKCPALKVNNARVKNMNLNFLLADSVVHVRSIRASYDRMRLRGSGFLDFTDPDSMINIDLFAEGMLPEIPGVKSLSEAYSVIDMSLRGNESHMRATNMISMEKDAGISEPLAFRSIIDFNWDHLKVKTVEPAGAFIASASYDLNSREKDYEFSSSNFHEVLYRLPEFKGLKNAFNFNNTMLTVRGNDKNTTSRLDFAWKNGRENPERTGTFNVNIAHEPNQRKVECELNARFGDLDYFGRADLTQNDEGLRIRNLYLRDILSGYCFISNDENKSIDARLDFEDSDLAHICNIFTLDSSIVTGGEVSGGIRFSGDPSNPSAAGEIAIQDGAVNNIGIYNGNILFDIKDKLFTLRDAELNKVDGLRFRTSGTISLEDSDIDMRLSARDIDLNTLFRSFADSENLIHGIGEADLRMSGSLNQPELTGTVSVGEGRFTKIGFDSLHAELEAHGKNTGTDIPGLVFKRLSIERDDVFQILGNGFIPYSSENELELVFRGEGDILAILPDIQSFFKETGSHSNWDIRFSGTPGNVVIGSGEININDGYLKLDSVAPEIKNINSRIKIEPDGFVKVEYINGTVEKRRFAFANKRTEMTSDSVSLVPFSLPNLGLDFGVFYIETAENGVPLHIPGLMAKGENGYFEFTGRNSEEKFYFSGPVEHPLVRGVIRLRNVNIMYPFDSVPGMDEENPVVTLLRNIDWNVKAVSLKDTRYENEIPSGVDKVYINLVIDSGVSSLDFNGIISEESFRIEGALESSEGIVDYLDFDFRIQKAGAEFDRSTLVPMVYGKAEVAIADSLGNPNHIYLTLLIEDELSGSTITRGRWGNIQFQITTDNPNLGLTDAEILASLGYSGSNIREKATDIIGISTDNLVFRPLLRPFERQIERTFNLDLVRVSSRLTRNLIEMNLWKGDIVYPYPKLYLLRSTRVMVGKYLADKVFLTYTGQLEAGMNYRVHGEELGLKHTLGLEYRINPSLLLEMEYNYNSFLLQREDKRIFLRHSFPIQ
jgi:hypothetical protein